MKLSTETPEAGSIDQAKLSSLQITVMVLCGLVVLLDGFDTQAIGYVAPRIAQEWGIAPSAFGPIFSAGLFGLLCGNFFLGPLADKWGRKSVILLATAIFGIFALLTATAATPNQLLLYRFLTGIGLGGALPNLIALTSEYAPERYRATAVMVMFCGFPLGSTVGGLVAGPLMDASGWRAVFLVGGAAPILMLPVLLRMLPESVRFLAVRGASEEKIGRILQRINPGASTAGFIADVQAERDAAPKGFTVPQLFTNGRAPSTLLLWAVFFMSLLVYYFLVNWLPTLVRESGLPLSLAIMSTAVLNLGGVVGAIILARLLDRWSPFIVLGLTYVAGAVFIAMVAYGTTSATVLLISAALAGFATAGGQIGSNALAAALYPTAIRSTGVGWALGMGRVGAIIGPLVAGGLLGLGWTPRAIIQSAVVPALLAAGAVLLLGLVRRKAWRPDAATSSAASP